MIKLELVTKQYQGATAVDEISFDVAAGEKLVLLGTSGCGKTTTLRMINRLTEPTSGTITVNGKNITQLEPETLRRGIGYVLQHHGLFPHYTVAENIAVVPKLLRWKKQEISERTAELMQKLQLPQTLSSLYPSSLSGGQQQRVGLARALAADPPVLLMDEPFGALDPVTRAGIRQEFKSLDELKRKTMIMVTHDVQEAFELADKICLMDKGKVIQLGAPAELLFQPVNNFVSTFLREFRLPLELKNIRINEVWTLLPKAVDGVGEKFLVPDSNLWDILEIISKEQELDNSRFVASINGEKKQLTIASLMAAYSRYKIRA